MMTENELLRVLETLPDDWPLVALGDRKNPYQQGWQHRTLNKLQIATEFASGKAKAVGIILGGDLMAVDHDGDSCDRVIESLSGMPVSEALPKSVSFTSGRTGRYQVLYRVPDEFQTRIRSKALSTGEIDSDGKSEQLDFRYSGCQSAIAGHHPTTGAYRWLNSPELVPVADCPQWILDYLASLPSEHESNAAHDEWEKFKNAAPDGDVTSLLTSALEAIDPDCDYPTWLGVGMALYGMEDEQGFILWDEWSRRGKKYKPGCTVKRWDSFSGCKSSPWDVLAIAKRYGWLLPKPVVVPKLTLRDEIAAIAAISDPFDQWLTITEKSSALAVSVGHLKEGLKAFNKGSNRSTKGTDSISQAEFMSLEDEPIDFLVPGLLPIGELVLLTAPPKTGKTTLAVDLAYAVCHGERFLDERVPIGRVLLITPDSGSRSSRFKLHNRGFDASGDALRVMPRFFIDQIDLLEREIITYRPLLVIIDSLAAINRGSDINENDAAIGDGIYAIRDLMERHSVAGILIHHNRKSTGGTQDSIDCVRGSSAITGAVWGIWQLSRAPQNSNEYKLVCDLRDAAGRKLSLVMDSESFSFAVTEDSQLPDGDRSRGDVIQDILIQHSPNGLEKREIVEITGFTSDTVKTTLSRLKNNGVVRTRKSELNSQGYVYYIAKSSEQSPGTQPGTNRVQVENEPGKNIQNTIELEIGKNGQKEVVPGLYPVPKTPQTHAGQDFLAQPGSNPLPLREPGSEPGEPAKIEMSKVQKQSPGTQPGTNRVQVENEPGITTNDASVRESNLSEITPAQTDIIQELELIIAGGEYE